MGKLNEAEQLRMASLFAKNPNIGRDELAKLSRTTPNKARTFLLKQRTEKPPLVPLTPEERHALHAEAELRRLAEVNALVPKLVGMLSRGFVSEATLRDTLKVSPSELQSMLSAVAQTHEVNRKGQYYELTGPTRGYLPLEVLDSEDWIRIGLVGDTHLCCEEERLDALHAFYDLCEAEGLTTLLHAGNIVDGYIPRINGASVRCPDIDGQCLYVADNYPRRKGITTHYITADDHEGWWQKEGFNFGTYLQGVLSSQGRDDLKYLGHVEADVEIRSGDRKVMLKLQHPGGGSAYARSYTGQKQAEAFQPGEKPDILVQGHYHVSNYMFERGIHVLSLPGFQDQTIFARKKRLRMEVGGVILHLKISPAGGVARFRPEFTMFFDRKFYKPFLKSDRRLNKGALTIHE